MKKKIITESEFYMWRTLFAVAHADEVVSREEVRYLAEVLEDQPFSDAQHAVLSDDIKHPKNIGEMFANISSKKDQARFFALARKLVHADGDYGENEQAIMLKILTKHIKEVDIDELIGNIDMELEEEGLGSKQDEKTRSFLYSFRQRFLKDRFGK